METVEILQKARELISDESRWTQGSYAREKTKAGDSFEYVNPSSVDALCRCALGALHCASGIDWNSDGSVRLPGEEYLVVAMGGHEVALFNDTHSHADVLAAFDRAIAAAREAQP